MKAAWPERSLGEVVEFLDSKRRPITASERTPGPTPYYGANGVQDYVEGYLFDEPLVLLAEDGGHFDEPERGIAYGVSGKSWVNNHAHVLRPTSSLDVRYLARVLENFDARPFLTGSTRAKLTKSAASRMPIPVPPIADQRRIDREHLGRRHVLEVAPPVVLVRAAPVIGAIGEDHPGNWLAEAVRLVLLEDLEVVEALEEEEVGELLDHLEGIGDPARPEGVPDAVDL